MTLPWYGWLIFVVGGSLIVVVVVFLYGALMSLLTDKPSSASGRVERSRGDRVAFRFELEAARRPDLDEIAAALADLGLKRVLNPGSTADLELTGGSELRARLGGVERGGVDILPSRVELRVLSDGFSTPKLELLISDNYRGPLWRERVMEERYSHLAAAIRAAVESQLRADSL